MKDNNTVKSIIKYLVAPIVIIIIAVVLFDNIKINNNHSNEKRFKSIEEFRKNVNIEIDIPDGLYNCTDSEVIYSNGPFIQIGCEHFVLKIGTFVNYNADTLGLDNCISGTDKKYTVNNNSKSFVRYRLGCENLENCTVINWVEDGLSYGAILAGIRTEDEILNLLSINSVDIKEFYDTDDNTEESLDDTVEIELKNRYKITLPKTEIEITSVETSNSVIFYIGDKKAFMILDNSENRVDNIENIELKHGYVLEYSRENPFVKGTDEFKTFDTIISNIEKIAASIEY